MRKILLCVNATLLKGRPRNRIEEIRRLLTTRGCRVDLIATSPFKAGPSLSSEMLCASSPDAVYVCGGDGTVFDVLQTLAGTDIALGVIPFGTGNILAQNLKLARGAVATAAALIEAAPRPIRLGEVSLPNETRGPGRWVFMCAAGVGFHAALMSATSQNNKHLVGKPAYWAAGLQLLLSRPLEPFEIEVTTSTGKTATSKVCEAIALRVGELNVWRPGGGLQSSVLRLASVPKTSRLGFVKAISKALAAQESPVMTSEVRQYETTLPMHKSVPAKRPTDSVIYQDIVRVVCRPLIDYEYTGTMSVQADGEIIESSTTLPTTMIEMSQKTVNLLFPRNLGDGLL